MYGETFYGRHTAQHQLHPSREPNNLFVYMNHIRNQGEVERSWNWFKTPSNLLLTVQSVLLLWFILIVNVRSLSFGLWLIVHFI